MTTEPGVNSQQAWVSVTEDQSLTFSVKGQDEVRIALSEASATPGTFETREIVVGDVTKLFNVTSGGQEIMLVTQQKTD